MNTLKKLIGPGASLKKALLKYEKLNIDKKFRAINSLGNNLKVADHKVSNAQFETKLNPDYIEISFNSSLAPASMRKVFPYTWLRDNCKCPKCHNYLADEIERDLLALSEDIRPMHLKPVLSNAGHANQVEITCK
jgi:hypothetical protein